MPARALDRGFDLGRQELPDASCLVNITLTRPRTHTDAPRNISILFLRHQLGRIPETSQKYPTRIA